MRITVRRCLVSTMPVAALALLTGCGTNSADTAPAAQQISVAQSPASSNASTPNASTPNASTPSDAAAPAADAVVLGRDDDYSIGQSGVTLAVTCNGGGDVSIDANDVQLQLSGDCEDIDIDGSGNVVVAGNADELDVDGNNNTVTGDNIREVDVDGNDNTVRLQSTADIDVEGNANIVSYAAGQPSIDNEGNNQIGVG